MKPGWTEVELGAVCEIVGGATPSTGVEAYWGGDVKWATPKDLGEQRTRCISTTARTITREGLNACGAQMLPPGSVLLSSRAPIGLVAINTAPMATSQGFKSLVPDHGRVEPSYLAHWLASRTFYLQSLGSGATFAEISKRLVAKVRLPLPPLYEQRRIAHLLDAAGSLRQKRINSVILIADLTRSWFDERFATVIETVPMSEVISDFRYGTSAKSGPTGLPVLRIPNVVGGVMDPSELKTVEVSDAEFERLQLQSGDMLFVRSNGNPDYVGRSATFDPQVVEGSGHAADSFVFASYLIRGRPDLKRVNPAFLLAYLRSPTGSRKLRSRCRTSAGQYNINIEGLGSIEVPLVPLAEQDAFARNLQAAYVVQERHQRHLRQLDALFASLQYRAFTGAL
jgi:type I restriction enzyme, S subunit